MKEFMFGFAIPVTLLVGIWGAAIWHAHNIRPPEQPIAIKIDSMDEVKLNHMLNELSAQERQLSALEEDVQSILVEITKIRKKQK